MSKDNLTTKHRPSPALKSKNKRSLANIDEKVTRGPPQTTPNTLQKSEKYPSKILIKTSEPQFSDEAKSNSVQELENMQAKLNRLQELENMCASSSKSGMFSLIKLAQDADKLLEVHKQLSAELGHEPSKEVWASSCGIPILALERRMNAGVAAKQKIVTMNMGLVHKALAPYRDKTDRGIGGMTLKDLEQEGVFGLIRAVEKFDLSRTNTFSTYAMWWIRSVLRHAIAGKDSFIRIPYDTLQDVRKIRRARYRLQSVLDRTPSDRELATNLGWSLQKLRKYDVYSTQIVNSSDEPIRSNQKGESSVTSLADLAIDEKEDKFHSNNIQMDDIDLLLTKFLEPKERQVVRLRFGLDRGEGRTYTECAEILSCSAEAIRKQTNKSIAKLQEAMILNGVPVESLIH